jgi:hypothetical protein
LTSSVSSSIANSFDNRYYCNLNILVIRQLLNIMQQKQRHRILVTLWACWGTSQFGFDEYLLCLTIFFERPLTKAFYVPRSVFHLLHVWYISKYSHSVNTLIVKSNQPRSPTIPQTRQGPYHFRCQSFVTKQFLIDRLPTERRLVHLCSAPAIYLFWGQCHQTLIVFS